MWVFLRVLYRAQEETRRRQKGQERLAFSTVIWKQELQRVWLQGNVTGSTKISMQIWQRQSDKESGSLDFSDMVTWGAETLGHHRDLKAKRNIYVPYGKQKKGKYKMFYSSFKNTSVDLEARLSGCFCSDRLLRKKQIFTEVMEKLHQVFLLHSPVSCNRCFGDSKEMVKRGGKRRWEFLQPPLLLPSSPTTPYLW